MMGNELEKRGQLFFLVGGTKGSLSKIQTNIWISEYINIKFEYLVTNLNSISQVTTEILKKYFNSVI